MLVPERQLNQSEISQMCKVRKTLPRCCCSCYLPHLGMQDSSCKIVIVNVEQEKKKGLSLLLTTWSTSL